MMILYHSIACLRAGIRQRAGHESLSSARWTIEEHPARGRNVELAVHLYAKRISGRESSITTEKTALYTWIKEGK
jgi:hypothetical protein